MLLQDRILGLLAQHPGASQADIRAALSDCRPASIAGAIARLRDRGQIEQAGWGAYKLAAPKVSSPKQEPLRDPDQLARMMAGR